MVEAARALTSECDLGLGVGKFVCSNSMQCQNLCYFLPYVACLMHVACLMPYVCLMLKFSLIGEPRATAKVGIEIHTYGLS